MKFFLILGIGLWFWLGEPKTNVADWVWEDGAAPWEEIDAFYYPNRNDLSQFEMQRGLKSVSSCRDWVRRAASIRGDTGLTRGDYECGVGRLDDFGGIRVYRLTVR